MASHSVVVSCYSGAAKERNTSALGQDPEVPQGNLPFQTTAVVPGLEEGKYTHTSGKYCEQGMLDDAVGIVVVLEQNTLVVAVEGK